MDGYALLTVHCTLSTIQYNTGPVRCTGLERSPKNLLCIYLCLWDPKHLITQYSGQQSIALLASGVKETQSKVLAMCHFWNIILTCYSASLLLTTCLPPIYLHTYMINPWQSHWWDILDYLPLSKYASYNDIRFLGIIETQRRLGLP